MSKIQTPGLIGDMVFLNLLLLLAMAASWPIFRTPWLIVTGVVALLAAGAITLAAIRLAWSKWFTAIVIVVAYLVLGVLAGAPEIYGSSGRLMDAIIGVAHAPVTGWKNLLTLDLPLGTYREILSIAFFVFFAVSLGAFGTAWRSQRWWATAVPMAGILIVFGAAFGAHIDWRGPVSFLSFQALLGIAVFSVGLLWVLWRLSAFRRQALLSAKKRASGTLVGKRSSFRPLRLLTGFMMFAVALAGAGFLAPRIVTGDDRAALRSGVDPDLLAAEQISPLSTYREYFDDEKYSEPLFSVDGSADRIRVATLNSFDGTVAMAVPEGETTSRFLRVPSSLSGGRTQKLDIKIENYQGVWVPVSGDLGSLVFEGANRDLLTDGFFYNQDSETGIQTAKNGLSSGDSYTIESGPYLVASSEISTFSPGKGGDWAPEENIPDSVGNWIGAQDLGRSGADLLELISRLRNRGYLSHSLISDSESLPTWATDMTMSAVAPSRAGHSSARIDRLFTDLLERQNALPGQTDPNMLVSAVGDDEQFAVAGALIADRLGFKVRIVVGAVLSRESTDASAIPTCADGVCQGRNMSAWIEVQDGETGAWGAIDVTPQHSVPPEPDPEQRSDPKNHTRVEPNSVDALPPPVPNPRSSEANSDSQEPEDAPVELGPLWQAAAISGLVLLLLALPIVTIIGTKAFKASRRHGAKDPRDRVIGGWDEFVDRSIDRGMPAPTNQTRNELASLYAGYDSGAAYLASGADFAAFSSDPISEADAEHYWRVIKDALKTVATGENSRGALRAKLSLSSFRRHRNRSK